jgi:hypothetical protein
VFFTYVLLTAINRTFEYFLYTTTVSTKIVRNAARRHKIIFLTSQIDNNKQPTILLRFLTALRNLQYPNAVDKVNNSLTSAT